MANSFYAGWVEPLTRWDDMTVVFNVLEPAAQNLVFYAMQMGFLNTALAGRGGAHCGPQVNGATRNINWGGYDDVAGGEFYGTISLDGFANVGNNNIAYTWEPGETYRMRVWRSPKQDWTAAQIVPTRATGQQPGEVAFRLDITRLSTGVTSHMRDLLIPDCATSDAMQDGVNWVEDFNTSGSADAIVPTQVRWTDPRVNGRFVPTVTATYDATGPANRDTYSDKVGIRQHVVKTRTVAEGTNLTLPGVNLRSTPEKVATGGTAASTAVLNRPAGVEAGDLLLAVLGSNADRGENAWTAPAGWTKWGSRIASAATGGAHAAMQVFYKSAGTSEPTSYTFTLEMSDFHTAILAAYAGRPHPSVIGGQGSVDSTTFTGPSVADGFNLSRMVWANVQRPGGAGTATGAPNGTLKRADTVDITGDWVVSALGDMAVPTPAGTKPARTGTVGLGNNAGMQAALAPTVALRPDADIAAGTWTTTPLFSKVNETDVDDTVYITGGNGAVATLGLSNPSEWAAIQTGRRLRFRYRKQDSTGTSTLQVRVMQGATQIATHTTTAIPVSDAWSQGEVTLTTAEVAAITDPNDLRLELTVTAA